MKLLSVIFFGMMCGGVLGQLPVKTVIVTKPDTVNAVASGKTIDLSGVRYQTKILLTRNADTVYASGYPYIIPTGTANLNMSAGRHFLDKNNRMRIRQSGYITKISIYKAEANPYGPVVFQVWRKDGTTYDMIAQEDITSKITDAAEIKIVTLTSPILVNEGDFVAIGGYGKWYGISAIDNSLLYATNPTTPDYAWDSQSAMAYILPIITFQRAPMIIGIGNSIIAGHPAHYSFIETSLTSSVSNQILYQMQQIDTNYVYQNLGIGSQTTTHVKNRFLADVLPLKPKIAIIEGGVNDIAGGTITRATFLSNYKFMLDSAIKYNIVPVIMKITPWTDGDNSEMQKRDDWCAGLDSLTALYPSAIFIDLDATVGKFRTGGDAGNLWDIKTEYDADGVHFNIDGLTAIARKIDAEIKKRYRFR